MFNIAHGSALKYLAVLQLIGQDNTTQGLVTLLVSYPLLKVLLLNLSITQPANLGMPYLLVLNVAQTNMYSRKWSSYYME